MTPQILLVYGILLAAILLFVSERLRLDVVALLAMLALSGDRDPHSGRRARSR